LTRDLLRPDQDRLARGLLALGGIDFGNNQGGNSEWRLSCRDRQRCLLM